MRREAGVVAEGDLADGVAVGGLVADVGPRRRGGDHAVREPAEPRDLDLVHYAPRLAPGTVLLQAPAALRAALSAAS